MSDEAVSPGPREPAWVRHAIAWHVFPLGAVGAEPLRPDGDPAGPSSPAGAVAAEHRLLRLVPWLDHLVGLGANVLQLGPVLDSMSHGYDTVDYLRVDPRLGTEEDLVTLIAEAHARGVKVMLDGVFNHTGLAHPAFARLAQEGPSCASAGMYRLTWPGGEEAWVPGTAPGYERFEGQDWLPALNHASPEVAGLVAGVMEHWCERGVDGWRLDAAYAVDPVFWRSVLPRVRDRFPQVYVYGEVIHGDYAGVVEASGMDAVTQYELRQAVWHSLADANLFELDWTLTRHAEMLGRFVPWTFVGNHDTTRIASALGDRRLLGHALALLLLLPGTPAVYYGDEEGLEAVKEERLGGDDAIRAPLPPAPWGEESPGAPTRHLHAELIALRRRLPWLHDAVLERLHLDNRLLSVALRPREAGVAGEGAQAEGVVLALSLEQEPAWLPTGGRGRVLAGAHGLEPARPVDDGVALPPMGWAVLG
ncbi:MULTISPECIES: alpha-amylase family glycosyl hydrolase [unclassified Actinomyces]|uniref:alpha-amylase family glycosyl hydrolase n=1 Tax=unclassified Actinomyces TaxID=2609248 RepID=UPI002016AAA4|nr:MULTISPECIES: alpha-amylase family glycosyl hydrolase [unclassified Actinomyces]MCL3777973.1 alpha-amylase [Actinomyces sp. AC-20-1]MCL3790860.1 alpha-amylase [Actinomyces sp. 187325]MCL3793131.1 alpha-amylase [Actinomyces sp. 186855]MCL3795507.1 alpha-amylase [Actinomyces sp. 217892]